MLAQSDLICVATTISMKSPSMYRNLSFIEHFFRVEDWRDRCLWHQSFNFFLCFFNIPVWLENSFKAVLKVYTMPVVSTDRGHFPGWGSPLFFISTRGGVSAVQAQHWEKSIESLYLRLCGFSLTHLAMIPVVVFQPSSSFPSGHDQGGGEVVVTNLFTMALMLVVIGWGGGGRAGQVRFIKQKCLFVMFVMRISPPRLLLYPWQQQQRLPCRRYNEKCSEITAQYQCL